MKHKGGYEGGTRGQKMKHKEAMKQARGAVDETQGCNEGDTREGGNEGGTRGQ